MTRSTHRSSHDPRCLQTKLLQAPHTTGFTVATAVPVRPGILRRHLGGPDRKPVTAAGDPIAAAGVRGGSRLEAPAQLAAAMAAACLQVDVQQLLAPAAECQLYSGTEQQHTAPIKLMCPPLVNGRAHMELLLCHYCRLMHPLLTSVLPGCRLQTCGAPLLGDAAGCSGVPINVQVRLLTPGS